MIQEDYVSFEVAKLLKEKGFDELTDLVWYEHPPVCYHGKPIMDYFYGGREKGTGIEVHFKFKNSDIIAEYHSGVYSAPTLQMAMKWLREVHGLAIIIKPNWHEGDMRNPCFWWYEIWGLITTERDYSCEGLGRGTYEKAAEEAIRYCLENLI